MVSKGSDGDISGRQHLSEKVFSRRGWISCVIAVAGLFAVLFVVVKTPVTSWIVWNDSPSMPTGFYGLTRQKPARDATVLFDIPVAARLYAQRRGLPISWEGFLKPVAAVAGDEVCVSFEEGLRINGERLAEVKQRDSAGVTVAAWIHCRKLLEDEFFLYAPRVSHSYDSRYYGPVRGATIKGVYEALWTW